MAIYTIADLHLSFSTDKPMDVFGEEWQNHEERLKESWANKVNNDDLVVLPGDFSWATYLKDTLEDFKYLNELPGKKVLLEGNHDYWWSTLKKMKEFIEKNEFENIDFIKNNAIEFENKIIVGTRGWNFLEDGNLEKMINRETIRLENSIQYGINEYGNDKEILCFLHYPPITRKMESSPYIGLMNKYNIKKCFYGHLHGNAHSEAIEGKVDNVELKLISADYLNFDPYLICN